MATKNNLQAVLKRLGSNGSGSQTIPTETPTPAPAAKASKFKPASKVNATVRRVPSLPSFSTAGFGKKAPPPTTPIPPAPATPAKLIPTTPTIPEVTYVEKKSHSPGTKREAVTEPRPIKRLKELDQKDKENQRETPSRRKDASPKGKSVVKARTPLPLSSDDDDKPWLRMEVDESFNPNPFRRLATDFPTLLRSETDEASTLRGKLSFNEALQKENNAAIDKYRQSQDPCVDIATLESIRVLLCERIQSLRELNAAIHPEDSFDTITTSPYFRDTPSSYNNASSNAVASSSTPVRQSPTPIDIDSDEDLWDDMDDIPDLDGDTESVVEVIEDPPSSQDSAAHKALMQSPYYPEIMSNLQRVYNLQGFRQNQLEAIIATMGGQDVFVLMPTGGGKSLCYQLPGVCKSGKTRGVSVVVSPLLALMQNQVQSLTEKGVDVLLWNSETADVPELLRRLRSSTKPDLLYVTPEKLKESGSLRSILTDLYRQSELARFVIDEAHCISTWGKNFREAYQCLGALRDDYPKVPIMALTATANNMMVDDIMQRLQLKDCAFFIQSFNRPNLNYRILPKRTGVVDDIVKYIQKEHPNQTGVLYCLSRDKCERVAAKLRAKGLSAKHFHAGMEQADKERVQTEWQNGQCLIIVATIAFGMGIDKPNVRFVIHHDLPTSLDGYYQQTGRAGRDGLPADCIFYYAYNDFHNAEQMIRKGCKEKNSPREDEERQVQDARLVMQYAQDDTNCRRVHLLQFFGEKFDPSKCRNGCDNCANTGYMVEQDMTKESRAAIDLVRTLSPQNLTVDQARSLFRGKAVNNKLACTNQSFFGAGSHLAIDLIEQLFSKLLTLEVFTQVSILTGKWHNSYLQLGRGVNAFLKSGKFVLRYRPKAVTDKAAPKKRKAKA